MDSPPSHVGTWCARLPGQDPQAQSVQPTAEAPSSRSSSEAEPDELDYWVLRSMDDAPRLDWGRIYDMSLILDGPQWARLEAVEAPQHKVEYRLVEVQADSQLLWACPPSWAMFTQR